jgi:hypothetical protein
MIPSIGEKKGKHIVYTIEQCVKCGEKTKRVFKLGDYVFKEIEKCQKCHDKKNISMIFSEKITPA